MTEKRQSRSEVLRSAAALFVTSSWAVPSAMADGADAATSLGSDAIVKAPNVRAVTKTIGQIPASGIIFKDIVKVERLDDPKVNGIQVCKNRPRCRTLSAPQGFDFDG